LNLGEKGEVTGGWREMDNKELHNLYSSPSIIRVIRSRRLRWAGHASCMGGMRNACRFSLGNLKDIEHM
jgi:hypothetical protein